MALAAPQIGSGAPAVGRSLRITRILIQVAHGRRPTPVAPNAFIAHLGSKVSEPVLRLQTEHGLEGIGRHVGSPEHLHGLLGLDPFQLFEWDGDTVRGPAERHSGLLARLAGVDIALLDLLGKAIGRPAADLLGPRVRDSVPVYDSTLYMEDLLSPAERNNLAYLQGGPEPAEPAEMVARKAAWLLDRPGGIRAFKIKIGRVKWMEWFEAALERDIAVAKAVRRAVGPDVILFADGNDGYRARPEAASEFAEATATVRFYWLEEMFPEEMLDAFRTFKRRLRAAGLATKLADGETYAGGIPTELLSQDSSATSGAEEPLFDVNQPDMNDTGFLRMRDIARACAGRRMTVSPHNFGSKLGVYAQAHQGLVTPNWEFCESDDSAFPAFRAEGVRIADGRATLTNLPGLGVALDEAALEEPTFSLDA